jgi:hypothetical protein
LSRAWNGLLEADRLKAVGLNREDGAKKGAIAGWHLFSGLRFAEQPQAPPAFFEYSCETTRQ